MYIPIWALLILLIACVWAVATRASRSYAEAVDIALTQAVRDLGEKMKSAVEDMKGDLQDLRNDVDQLQSDTEAADDKLRTDLESQAKEIDSLKTDLNCLRLRRGYEDDERPPWPEP